MGDFDSIKIGVCTVKYTPAGGVETDLGLTAGGVLVKYRARWHEIKADQYGDTTIDAALIGENISVRIPMLETTVAKMKLAMPSTTLITEVAGSKLNIGSRPGKRAQDVAGLLVIHPISAGASVADDISIYKAVVLDSEIELPYKIDGERVLQVDFVAIVDKNKTDGNLLAHIGDAAIDGVEPV